MSRDSRFDKLEQPRTVDTGESKPALTRFEPGPEPATVSPELEVQGVTERLARFEEDGKGGLKLDFDALAELPMLQCPECLRESSKWDQRCIHCQASLTSLAATAHNLQRLEALRLVRETEKEVAAEKREATWSQIANEKAEAILTKARTEREAQTMFNRVIGACVAVGALILLFMFDAYIVKLVFFVVFLLAVVAAIFRR
jgi:hypothetical protein